MNTIIKLLGENQKGNLELSKDIDVPLNFSLSDIRNIENKTGNFSKTIIIPGTNENNKLLNNYYDVNILDGTFNVNKIQECQLIRGGEIVLDNCNLILLKVIFQHDSNLVNYEVQITDNISSFFKEINNKNVDELISFEEKKIIQLYQDINNSFFHNQSDHYKYILPWINDSTYNISEIFPGIYLKSIFDAIHKEAGFEYEWVNSNSNIEFDKLIIPYNGDPKKMDDKLLDETKILVRNNASQQDDLIAPGNINTTGVNGSITLNTPIVDRDDNGYYVPTAPSYFDNPYLIGSSNQSLIYKGNFNISLFIFNLNLTHIATLNKFQVDNGIIGPMPYEYKLVLYTKNQHGVIKGFQEFGIENVTTATSLDDIPTGDDIGVYDPDTKWTKLKSGFSINPNGNRTIIADQNFQFEYTVNNIAPTDELHVEFGIVVRSSDSNSRFQWFDPGGIIQYPPVDVRFRYRAIRFNLEIQPTNGLMMGSELPLSLFLPKGIKQSEIIKSVFQMYNLFYTLDPIDKNKIIYQSRDEFYDSGNLLDWTDKQCLDLKTEQIFLPEITTKELILSYKDDNKDEVLTSYKDKTKKTKGQVSVRFENENIKGTERKELIFSPTFNMETEFNAILPLLNEEKYNIRLLIDGGMESSTPFVLKEIDDPNYTHTLSSYPMMSMFNDVNNPKYSIEYANSDYYLYNPGILTNNNLYTNYWQRTFAQINGGRMLRSYFILNDRDISTLKLNDKIKVDNKYYYINKIVDYNANKNIPTLVELLTTEEELKLPRIGSSVIGGVSGIIESINVPIGTYNPPVINGEFVRGEISKHIRDRIDRNNIILEPTDLTQIHGMNNIISKDFKGIILGNNMNVQGNGFYIDENNYFNGSGLITNGINFNEIVVDVEGKEDISNKVVDLNNPDDITYPTTQAVYDAINNIPSGGGIVDITRSNLITLRNNNNLEKGTTYHITDRDIYLYATTTNTLSIGGYRRFNIIDDQYYTPHSTTGLVINNYGGIYGQTYTPGTTPNSNASFPGTIYYAIWGGKMWRRNNIGVDGGISNNSTLGSGWTVQTNTIHYIPKIFNIKYNLDDDFIWEQSDDRGNVIKSFNITTNYIDITDWGNNNIYNNECYGIYNNYQNSTTKASISYNSNNGDIHTNSNNGGIYKNSNEQSIMDNSNNGSISNNSNTGSFSYIWKNSNNGSINRNMNNGQIVYNSNNGEISYNSNNGNIQNNSNNGEISYNSNNGNIRYNRSLSTGSFVINNNQNNGHIIYNSYNTISNHSISSNTNNGRIGSDTTYINRTSSITNAIVDK